MTATIAQNALAPELVERVLNLDVSQREQLGHLLLDSVESNEESGDAWRAEIRRRAEDWISGRVIPLDSDEVFRELDRKYGESAP